MKNNYLILLAFYCLASFAQTVNYSVDDSDFPNPERGFYHHTETHSANYDFLEVEDLSEMRDEENITLIIRVFYLESYIAAPMPPEYLTKLKQISIPLVNPGSK